MSNARLIEALTGLPQMLREVIPSSEEQTRALAAMKLALDEQAEANRQFVEALKPLPEFVRAAANLPETARKQMWALEQLTSQLEQGSNAAREQGEQVKVMVETLVQQNAEKGAQVQGMVENLARYQRAQLRQQVNALKAGQEALASQRRHQAELERAQQSRLNLIQRQQAQSFERLEEHFRSGARRQMVITGIAAVLAIGALVFAALVASGVFGGSKPAPQAEAERRIPAGAVVSR
jgi:chromosome segregation ATPase